MKQVTIILLTIIITGTALAQRRPTLDTTKPTTVVVTSTFKPSLKPAAKINFSAATPAADTTRPSLVYTVPSQNLFFSYQPAALRPLALAADTATQWNNHNYVKVGYGNFTTPYLRTGLSFGDGSRSLVNVHAGHVSSRGQLPFQQFSRTNITGIGVFNSNNRNEWTTRVHLDLANQYRYGFQPDTLKFTRDQLRQNFTSYGGRVGLRNKIADAALDYNPSIGVEFFNDNRGGKETDFSFALPASRSFGRAFALSVGLYGDVTSLKTPDATYDNNLFYLKPAFQFKTPNLKVNAGFTPSWDNSVFNLLPNFTAEAKIKDERFAVEAGWVGYFQRNIYRNLAAFNPFIAQPGFSNNSLIREQYAGLKGSAGNHLTYNGRVSLLNYNNVALFVNDTLFGNSFQVVNEPSMKVFRIHGEVGYTVQEKFSFLAGATFNRFSNLEDYDKAYGLLPLELTGTLRWQILKDLAISSDVFFWDGPQYRTKAGNFKQKAAVDVNLGMELGITPRLSGWLQFNNILNNEYQRWNQFRVLGFNVLGGVVYSFGKIPAR